MKALKAKARPLDEDNAILKAFFNYGLGVEILRPHYRTKIGGAVRG